MKNHKSRMTCIKNSLLAAANLGFTHAVPFLAWGDERGGYANSLSPDEGSGLCGCFSPGTVLDNAKEALFLDFKLKQEPIKAYGPNGAGCGTSLTSYSNLETVLTGHLVEGTIPLASKVAPFKGSYWEY